MNIKGIFYLKNGNIIEEVETSDNYYSELFFDGVKEKIRNGFESGKGFVVVWGDMNFNGLDLSAVKFEVLD